jgi:hypothetical protein
MLHWLLGEIVMRRDKDPAAYDPSLPPERRRLKIYAGDPMSGRRASQRIAIDIENEPDLKPGPDGAIVQVVDYDGRYECYYEPVDLNKPAMLMENGLEPSEADPQFHQQMVYAVAMKVTETARRALGRPITFYRRNRPLLRLMPHAFVGANAFFDPDLNAILFGYFRASKTNPGPNLPGQCVFTCLSHDIIAHEVTHAIVHRLRRHFLEPTNMDVLAFHEAFSDLVALFQRFSYRELLSEQLQAAGGRIELAKSLVDLAQQFGMATGTGKALRSGIGSADPTAIGKVFEPHQRGAILVSAVFGGFLRVAGRRADALFHIASGGDETKPQGQLTYELLSRIAAETAQVADRVLRMCFRAFDYLPPVDVTFGDFLRALVTADFELNANDPDELRFAMVEEFRKRGIYPEGVVSLAEEALILPSGAGLLPLPRDFTQHTFELLAHAANALDWSARARTRKGGARQTDANGSALKRYSEIVLEPAEEIALGHSNRSTQADIARGLHRWATENASPLELDGTGPISVAGFHPVFRVGADQKLVVELVAQFVQRCDGSRRRDPSVTLRGGATVVFGADNVPRYRISKPCSDMPKAFAKWEEQLTLLDPRTPWIARRELGKNPLPISNLRRLHGG